MSLEGGREGGRGEEGRGRGGEEREGERGREGERRDGREGGLLYIIIILMAAQYVYITMTSLIT